MERRLVVAFRIDDVFESVWERKRRGLDRGLNRSIWEGSMNQCGAACFPISGWHVRLYLEIDRAKMLVATKSFLPEDFRQFRREGSLFLLGLSF